MPIIKFESSEDRIKKEVEKLANEIAQEAIRNFDYDPDDDPVMREFRKKLGLRKNNNK